MSAEIEPLAPNVWFERIEMIADQRLACTESALRHALHLLQLTPTEFKPRDDCAIDEAAYEALLAAGKFDEAARRLVFASTLTVSATSATSPRPA